MSPASGSRRLLWPLSVLYSMAARMRVWCYARGIFRARKLPGTVISVGNLTVGGTGKTPMVLWIAERLTGEGKSTAILTRGYRGHFWVDLVLILLCALTGLVLGFVSLYLMQSVVTRMLTPASQISL